MFIDEKISCQLAEKPDIWLDYLQEISNSEDDIEYTRTVLEYGYGPEFGCFSDYQYTIICPGNGIKFGYGTYIRFERKYDRGNGFRYDWIYSITNQYGNSYHGELSLEHIKGDSDYSSCNYNGNGYMYAYDDENNICNQACGNGKLGH